MSFHDAVYFQRMMWRRKQVKEAEKRIIDERRAIESLKDELKAIARQNGEELDVDTFIESGNFGESVRER